MNMITKLERKEVQAGVCCHCSPYPFTPLTMTTAIAFLPKILPDGLDAVCRDAWRHLADTLRAMFVSLHVHDHPPHGAFHPEPDAPFPHLLLLITAETDEEVDRALNEHAADIEAITLSYRVIAQTRETIGDVLASDQEAYVSAHGGNAGPNFSGAFIR